MKTFATFFIGVGTIELDCDNCEHNDSCDHIKASFDSSLVYIVNLSIFDILISYHIDGRVVQKGYCA